MPDPDLEMAVKLNHTIVHARDKRESAEFYCEIFGFPPPKPFGPFLGVLTPNEVTLDFFETEDDVDIQHFAFLVSDAEFDEIFARLQARGLDYWADPGRTRSSEINRNDGGRGVYFLDPCGHVLEIITRPYGSGA